MTIAECRERWLIQTERNICLIENEFGILNEDQFNYRQHVRHCNIKENMNFLYVRNSRLIPAMNRCKHMVNTVAGQQEFSPGWISGYFLSHARFVRCISARRNRHLPPEGISGKIILSRLLEQEYKLKEFISSSSPLDMNKRIVPFALWGLLKISLAETLEYMMLYHQGQFTRARHLLVIQ